MTQQTEAQRLARILEDDEIQHLTVSRSEIAAELRRLEAANEKFHERQIWWSEKLFQLEAKNERLRRIEEAAANLVRVKGRYHTEQALKALAETLKETP